MSITTGQSTQTIAVGATPVTLLGSSPRRAAIILSPVVQGGATILSIGFRQNIAAGNGMLNFVLGIGYVVILTDGDVGDIIQTELFAVTDAGAMDVTVTEIVYQ